jgi:hypothetical protein
MPRDVAMQNAAAVRGDDKETVENSEADRGDGEEVHGCNRFPVIAQECQPPLSWFGVSRRAAHPTGNCPLGHVKTEHEKFAMNARCAPALVLGYHPKNQVSNFFRDPFSASSSRDLRDQTPIYPKAGSVPANHRLGCNEGKRTLPAAPKPTCANPEQPVVGSESRSWVPTLQHRQLLTKCEVLQEEASAFVEEAEKDSAAQPEETEHGLAL